jgi:GAF domain-containing protein
MGANHDRSDRTAAAALSLLASVAQRVAGAHRLEFAAGDAVLRTIVEAAAALIGAEAASIALHDSTTDRLVFRVAAGEHGQGIVGVEVGSGEGVAGYVFATGQPIAIGEATADPRFQRETAEATGYVPRSILAVPLTDSSGTIGVLEVLDRRDGEDFDLHDMNAGATFARQATVAIRATQFERDTATLLRDALVALAGASGDLTEADIEALVAAAVAGLEGESEDGPGIWSLAEAVARVRRADPDQIGLVTEILESLARRSEGLTRSGSYRAGPAR